MGPAWPWSGAQPRRMCPLEARDRAGWSCRSSSRPRRTSPSPPAPWRRARRRQSRRQRAGPQRTSERTPARWLPVGGWARATAPAAPKPSIMLLEPAVTSRARSQPCHRVNRAGSVARSFPAARPTEVASCMKVKPEAASPGPRSASEAVCKRAALTSIQEGSQTFSKSGIARRPSQRPSYRASTQRNYRR